MSRHQVEVVPVVLEPHPNADSLSVVRVRAYTVVVKTDDWKDRPVGAYIEPDYVVPADSPQFAFLAAGGSVVESHGVRGYRIRVRRFRGVVSMGLLIPAPEGARPGDDVMARLGVVRYEPPAPATTGGDAEAPPTGVHPTYDVETAYRYSDLFAVGEEVVASEKIDGASARFCFRITDDAPAGRMYAGARNDWRKESQTSAYWRALRRHPEIEAFCRAHPEITVYGEVYGWVQKLRYGAAPGEVFFAAFDLLRDGAWVDHDEARALGRDLPWAPVLYRGPWDREVLFALAEGKSQAAGARGADQIREGIVVKPIRERTSLEIGRVQLKIVSNAYLEKS